MFWKVGQTSRSRPLKQKLWYDVKGLVTRNAHMQYKSPSSSGWKLLPRIKFLKSRSNFKVKVTRSTSKFEELWSPARQQIWPWDRSKVKVRSQFGTNKKGLSQWSFIPNINAVSLKLQKIWARLKFLWQRDRRIDRQMSFNVPRFRERRGTKIIVWCERSCLREHTCEVWKSYLLLFISYNQG